jgi:hypothetical protein
MRSPTTFTPEVPNTVPSGFVTAIPEPTVPTDAGSRVALPVPRPEEELPAAVPEEVCPGDVPSAVLPLSFENDPPGPNDGWLLVGMFVVVLVPKASLAPPPGVDAVSAPVELVVGEALGVAGSIVPEAVVLLEVAAALELGVAGEALELVTLFAAVTREVICATAGMLPRASATEVAMRTLRMEKPPSSILAHWIARSARGLRLPVIRSAFGVSRRAP